MVPTGREGPGEERDQDESVVHSGDDGDDGAVRVVGGEREDEDILGFERARREVVRVCDRADYVRSVFGYLYLLDTSRIAP